ncbi:hypothetical protein SASPL_145711 [Salvia splendens]|uniref:Translation initiation factor beta propellor-like domain-containing protein n=1 Tax=Salvia splendens TaxID=180675 RepID=A0A8X8WIP2_SALSN|nr:hypothetical protein SASPL_145711 [Salvia splendens]
MADVMSMEDLHATAARLNVDLDSLDLDSIRLPAGETFGIISDDEDLKKGEDFEFEEGFRNIIVVDNLPVEAELAKEKTHGYKLDRSHIFSVNMFYDIEKFLNVPEQWAPPESKPYTPGENLQKWLMDEKARDQFVIRAGTDTEVLWNDARQSKPELVYKRSVSEFLFITLLALALFIVSFALNFKCSIAAVLDRKFCPVVPTWDLLGHSTQAGCCSFNRLMRYQHSQVKLIDFSHGERFLVTYSSQEPSNPRDTHVIYFYDIISVKYHFDEGLMRDFKGSADEFAIGGTGGVSGVSWPVFRWGGGREDKYFARIGKNAVSVYETETFGLIDKKSIKVENVVDFSWSPTDSILALFVPELGGGNQPARVSLVQIPSKLIDTQKQRKAHIKERDIPIEVLELDNKNDKIIAFAWEPKGHRFAVIHGDNPRPDVSFYSMRSGTNTGRVSKLATLKGKLLYRILKDHFFQVSEKEEEIAKNLKKYSKKYETGDQDVSMLLSEQDRETGKMLKEEWARWIGEWKRLHEEEKLERQKLRDGEECDEEEEYEAKDVEVEELLDVTDEVISFD